jgi:hypothetical protein
MHEMERLSPPDLGEAVGEEGEGALFWLGSPAARLACGRDGQLTLSGVSLKAFQGIELPRQWDNPERAWNERGCEAQLESLCVWIHETRKVWTVSLRHLVA